MSEFEESKKEYLDVKKAESDLKRGIKEVADSALDYSTRYSDFGELTNNLLDSAMARGIGEQTDGIVKEFIAGDIDQEEYSERISETIDLFVSDQVAQIEDWKNGKAADENGDLLDSQLGFDKFAEELMSGWANLSSSDIIDKLAEVNYPELLEDSLLAWYKETYGSVEEVIIKAFGKDSVASFLSYVGDMDVLTKAYTTYTEDLANALLLSLGVNDLTREQNTILASGDYTSVLGMGDMVSALVSQTGLDLVAAKKGSFEGVRQSSQ